MLVEVTVFLALMEKPPFGKGDSDIMWALPASCLIVVTVSTTGLLVALVPGTDPRPGSKPVIVGLILNGLSLAIPLVVLLLSIVRALFT